MKKAQINHKIVALLMGLLPLLAIGQQAVEWSFNFGGSASDDLTRIITCSQGGFLAGGNSRSADFDLPSNAGSSDVWVVKLNDLGLKEFVSVLGGGSEDIFKDALEVDNAYYLTLINSYSANGDFPASYGGLDIWLKSITYTGQIGGSLHLGGSGTDEAVKLAQAPAGGHLIVGQTNSIDGTFGGGMGGKDAFCIRLSSTSQITWVKKFGTKDNDGFVDAMALPDGNLLFLGSKYQSMSNTGWLLKTNSLGDFLEEVDIEKSTGVFPLCMMQHAGYIYVAANTNNLISKVTDRHMMIYKFDENLDYVSMIETGGGGGSDIILDMKPYDDDHLLCLVASNTDAWPFNGNRGNYDLFYLLLTNDFDLVYNNPFGGSSRDGSYENGGNFVMDGTMAVCASMSFSTDGDLTANYGSADGWIFKANPAWAMAVNNQDLSTQVNLYPNPASEYTRISGVSAGAAVIIFNPAGQKVAVKITGDNEILDISSLRKGIYFLKTVNSSGRSLFGKLIKR